MLTATRQFMPLLTLLFLSPASGSSAQVPKPTAPPKGWTISGSWRLRPEMWGWFGVKSGDGHYTYVASLLRLSAGRQTPRNDILLELAQPTLLELPRHATVSAPQGQLGPGAAYRDASGSQEASVFLKQAFWRFKNLGEPANSLRLGRFEFFDGAETTPADPSMAWLKRERIAQRLIGNFGWSHIGRSLDGLQFMRNTPRLNLTAAGGFPTRGVFDLRGMDTLTGVRVGYAAATWNLPSSSSGKAGGGAGDARLFGIFYEDARRGVTKTDNRPAAIRAADKQMIRIGTVGGHYLRVAPTGTGKVDSLLWAAGQVGDWGAQSHEAFAFAVEAGYQPNNLPLKPWFRAGYYHASGDGSPGDGQHSTFFLILPTPRAYARFPFYILTNLQDAFAQVILRPDPKWTLRSDFHRLWLANRNDLWYAGGGAFQNAPSFGYAGRPSGGSGDLATLVDLSLDYQWRTTTTVSLYVGYASGGQVVRNIYTGREATLTYVELLHRW